MKYIYLLVGESGSGKSTIANYLEQKFGYKQLISYTTRKPRSSSENTHIFVTDDEFDKLSDIVAYTEFDGHRYCATKHQVDESALYVIDPKGVKSFKAKCPDKPCKIIFLKTTVPVRYERMKERAIKDGYDFSDAVNAAINRITNDIPEFYDYECHIADVDLVLTNDDKTIESVGAELKEYIEQCENNKE